MTRSESVARFFSEHGWIICRGLLDDGELDAIRQAATVFLAMRGRQDRFDIVLNARTNWRIEDGPRAVQMIDHALLRVPELTAVIRESRIPALAAELNSASEIRYFNSALIVKASSEPMSDAEVEHSVGWHADRAYWPTCSSQRMLTAWIPFQDSRSETGTLRVIDRSHWLPDDPALATVLRAKNFFARADSIEVLRAAGWPVEAVTLDMRAGDVSFHHARTLHGSGPNRSGKPRSALAIHFQDGENHWRRSVASDGSEQTYINDLLCRRDANGSPDYSDTEICPLLWPVGGT